MHLKAFMIKKEWLDVNYNAPIIVYDV